MDPRDRTVDELVNHFMEAPGSAESAQLDFKAKEIVETTDGKRDLAKKASAIANTRGGTIIVGVGEGNREDIIQSFTTRSEIKRDLVNVFRDNTNPPLDQYTEINVEKYNGGPRLLRIDIQAADHHPIEFYDRSANKHIPYHRVEDTTRKMGTTDLLEFSTPQTGSNETTSKGLTDSISFDGSDIQIFDDSTPRKSPPNRAILNIDCHGLVVPAALHLDKPYQKSLTYHLETRANGDGLSALEELMDEAETELNADFDHDFGYGIKYGTKQLIGRNAENFISDIDSLDQTLEWLGRDDDADTRPIAMAGTRSEYGFVWFQAQYHTGSLTRIKCGVILSDIPLQTEPLKRLFGDKRFEQDNSLRTLRVGLDDNELQLSNSEPIRFDESSFTGTTEVLADNPLYQNKEALDDSVPTDVYAPFLDALSSVDRLPYTVRGGYAETDAYHTFGEIHVSHFFGLVPTYFVWPLCIPNDT